MEEEDDMLWKPKDCKNSAQSKYKYALTSILHPR